MHAQSHLPTVAWASRQNQLMTVRGLMSPSQWCD